MHCQRPHPETSRTIICSVVCTSGLAEFQNGFVSVLDHEYISVTLPDYPWRNQEAKELSVQGHEVVVEPNSLQVALGYPSILSYTLTTSI